MRADFIETVAFEEVAIVEPEHRQRTGLDHHDLAACANVLEQYFAGFLSLLLRRLDQALRQRSASVGGNVGELDFDSNLAEYLDCGKSSFRRAVIGENVGE